MFQKFLIMTTKELIKEETKNSRIKEVQGARAAQGFTATAAHAATLESLGRGDNKPRRLYAAACAEAYAKAGAIWERVQPELQRGIFLRCLKKTSNAVTTDAETRTKLQRVMSSELVQAKTRGFRAICTVTNGELVRTTATTLAGFRSAALNARTLIDKLEELESQRVQRVQRITELRAFINTVRELPQPVVDTLLQYPQMQMPCGQFNINAEAVRRLRK